MSDPLFYHARGHSLRIEVHSVQSHHAYENGRLVGKYRTFEAAEKKLIPEGYISFPWSRQLLFCPTCGTDMMGGSPYRECYACRRDQRLSLQRH